MEPIKPIDELKLYFGEDYAVSKDIMIHQPTIGQIVAMGEQQYFSMVYSLCSIPSDLKSRLYDLGIDYETISDFQLFTMLCPLFHKEDTAILFGSLDFSRFILKQNTENGELVLHNETTGQKIDRLVYQIMVDYLRKMHGITPKVEHAGNSYTKKILIEEDRRKREAEKRKPFHSILRPLISGMVNSPGFKYNLEEVKNLKLCPFMDSVRRIPVIQSASSLLNGCYSGMIDTNKIKKSELDWLRDLD